MSEASGCHAPHGKLPPHTQPPPRLLPHVELPRPGSFKSARSPPLLSLHGNTQEHSLLADLRVVVARALSGLDMFASAAGTPAPAPPAAVATIPEEGGLSPSVRASLTAALPALGAPPVTPPPSRGGAGEAGGVVRRATVLEGLYSGLPLPLGAARCVGTAAGLPEQHGRRAVSTAPELTIPPRFPVL